MKSRIFLRLAFAFLLLCGLRPANAATTPVDFARDILPLLSDRCFHCHGPDEKSRKAKLRLDTREGAFRVVDGQAVILPGQSAQSELIRRITTQDPDDLMPPPDSNRHLTPQQVALLRRWVDEGARWGQHWAFETPRRPASPQVARKDWVRNPIDAFILAQLEAAQLAPAPPARAETLLRRVTLDLTGLPPSPAEVASFLADTAPDAYEKRVDRLLESPRYGERLASDWLDLARYADTHGYQADRYRAMWPWRDWVIKAFNQNLPYDQFITWQLAGDLLPNATREQRLATAFNRHHMQNEEGGIVEEEYRVAYVADRVNTMGTAFLGLTFECTRCHDHKYDPLTQRDYYSLFSFFQNIDESGQTTYFTDATPVPALLLCDEATDRRLAELQQQIAGREGEGTALRRFAESALLTWLTQKTNEIKVAGPVGAFAFEEIVSNRVSNAIVPTQPGHGQEGPLLVPGKIGQGLELSGENGITFPGLGHFNRAQPFSLALWLQTPTNAPRLTVLHHTKAPIDAGSRGYELLLEQGRLAVGLHHMWPGNSLKVISRQAIPTQQWVHVTATYDGSSRAGGVRLYFNGQSVPLEIVRDTLTKDITYERDGEPALAIGYRFRDNGFKNGRVDEFQVFDRVLTPLEAAQVAGVLHLDQVAAKPADQLTPAEREGLLDFYLARVYPPAQEREKALLALRTEHSKLINPIPEAMVMAELPVPRPAYILNRGAYDAPGEPVTADTPAVLPRFPSNAPRNRLGLARWLIDPAHPLTSRVTVNRAWQMMFGRGIVATSDNFGRQGTFPTHPELLDWLARDFVDGGWDMKQLLKLMATSATYRQSAVANADLLARDPANELLARGPARPLTAEMMRDQALAVSGLLAEKIGGPSVKPYQPAGLWEEKAMGAPRYEHSKGEDLYRRSLYTYWKRTVPHPAMIAFDAAERNVCVVKRQTTSTPLQALVLLNETQLVEAARFIGQRLLLEGGATQDEQLAWAFRLVTNRRPSAGEVGVLNRLYSEQHALFEADPAAALKLLGVGDKPRHATLNPTDLAAATVLAQALLNHDEAVMRR